MSLKDGVKGTDYVLIRMLGKWATFTNVDKLAFSHQSHGGICVI